MKNKLKKKSFPSLILIIIGIFIFCYPFIASLISAKNQTEAIVTYDEEVQNIDEEEKEKLLEEAKTYNENLSGDPLHDPFVSSSRICCFRYIL